MTAAATQRRVRHSRYRQAQASRFYELWYEKRPQRRGASCAPVALEAPLRRSSYACRSTLCHRVCLLRVHHGIRVLPSRRAVPRAGRVGRACAPCASPVPGTVVRSEQLVRSPSVRDYEWKGGVLAMLWSQKRPSVSLRAAAGSRSFCTDCRLPEI